MGSPLIQTAVSQNDHLISQVFALLHQPAGFSIPGAEVSELISPFLPKLNPELASLFGQIKTMEKSGQQLTLTLNQPEKTTLSIAGFTVDLFADEQISAAASPASLSLTGIKGLKAGMGLMKLDLQGVSFKRDGGAYLIDLQTAMKTFTVKIPLI